jgi:hypothetical protein
LGWRCSSGDVRVETSRWAVLWTGVGERRGLLGVVGRVRHAWFALDDAWIHQVYARNLGTLGEFAFFPGQPSAGSTSPLWTILLSIGYVLHLDFQIWSYLLGAVLSGASALVLARLTLRTGASRYPRLAFLVPLFVLFEWHMAWSAVSGMEIPLFVFLSVLLLERFYAVEQGSQSQQIARGLPLGLLAGLLTLTRPEGVVLGALVGVAEVIRTWNTSVRKRTQHQVQEEARLTKWTSLIAFGESARVLLGLAFGYALLMVPYLIFNLSASGTILPNTFYAKNVEYAGLVEQANFLVRWLRLVFAPWVGAQILLFPGVLWIGFYLVKSREWFALIPLAWVLLLPALYAARLPVDYQHGRYEMPIIPFIVLYGVWGTTALLERIKVRALRTTWVASTGVLLVLFWLLGGNAYATDVAIIDCEMVQTAQWVSRNAPSDALIAAHDIGALEYFYPRPLIDMAGLVSPDVIPFIRDQTRLRDYLYARHATFAVFFPDWYPAFASDPRFVPVHQTECAVTRAAGGTNLVVYTLR